MKDKVYVIDTSGFMKQMDFRDGNSVTVPAVVDEIIDSTSRLRLDLLKDAGLRIELPEKACLGKVRKASVFTGDAGNLSATDIDILSKALEKNSEYDVILVTDDYAVQNVAASLGIEYTAVTTPGISKRVFWELKCTGCGRVIKPVDQAGSGQVMKIGKPVSDKIIGSSIDCPVCGSGVRRQRARH